jgi:hypothetical protein
VFRLESSDDVSRSLKFVAPRQWEPLVGLHETLPASAGYKSFSEVPEFTIKFIHGPENKIYHIAGEIFPTGVQKNPIEGAVEVKFGPDGVGSVKFSKAQIGQFDLAAWGEPDNLQIKLVRNPGTWETPSGAYSSMGNNSIRPRAVDQDGMIVVDLGEMDSAPGDLDPNEKTYIAFEIDPSKAKQVRLFEGEKQWSLYGVAHNTSTKPVAVGFPSLRNPSDWVVLLDDVAANASGLPKSRVSIQQGFVVVPPKSSIVIARKGDGK